MEFSRVLVCWVVGVCLCLPVCEGRIYLCTDHEENGTTRHAEIGESVVVIFNVCLTNNERVYPHLLINRYMPGKYYANNSVDPINVKITEFAEKALINATFLKITTFDLDTPLTIKVFTISQTRLAPQGGFTYVFYLKRLAFKITPTSITTPISTTTRTGTETAKPTSSTCLSATLGKYDCPAPTYLIEDDRCLQLFDWDQASSPEEQCQQLNLIASCKNSIITLLKCYSYNSRRKILLSVTRYINSTDGSEKYRYSYEKYQFYIACFFDAGNLSPAKITSFVIQLNPENSIPLYNNSHHSLLVRVGSRPVSLVCASAGIPTPQFRMLHSEIIKGEIKQNGIKQDNTWSLWSGCESSGTYTCVANNSLGSDQIAATLQYTDSPSITKFVIINKLLGVDFVIAEKDPPTLLCEASGCPSPGKKLSLVNERGELLPANQSTNFITYKMSSVACSDMGRYYCRIQDETSLVQEKQIELKVWNCASQLCSHEQQNNTITSSVNLTVHISVCVISSTPIAYDDITERTSVNFIKHKNSQIYYTVNISIYNIQTSDSGPTNIKLRNYYGILTYTFFLKVQDNIAPERYQTSDADFNPIYVGVPIGLLVLAVIIGVFVYRIKKKQLRNAGTGNSNFNYYGNDDHQVTYANIQDFRNEDVNRRGQCLDKVEMETCQYNNLTPDNTDLDSGRTVTGDGLVYVTLANTSKSSTKKAGPAKPSSLRVTTKPRPEEFVEYTSLDLQKTGQVTLPDDEQVKTEEELEVCESQDTGVEDQVE